MTVITHRELRNSSSEILRRVGAGETFEITNHGVVVAVLSAPRRTPLEELIQQGRARPGDPTIDFRTIESGKSSLTSEEILADLRGDR